MLRIIGDVHSEYRQYQELIHNVEYSLQVGDFGDDYKSILPKINSHRHKMIAGNHDNHDDTKNWPHFLPKFGSRTHGGITFFHVQGAFSLDWQRSLDEEMIFHVKKWWPTEQLSYVEFEQALVLYTELKPDIVITHEAPRVAANIVGNPHVLRKFGYNPDTFTTHTSEALQAMFNEHKPSRWFFGHYHKSKGFNIEGTKFQCLDILNYIDI